jgi:hypothetical protein
MGAVLLGHSSVGPAPVTPDAGARPLRERSATSPGFSDKERVMLARLRSRIVVPALAVVIALSVAACGGDSPVVPGSPSSGASPAASVARSAAPSKVGPLPSPTLQPTASPSSAGVAVAFLGSLARGLSAEARLDGSVTIGATTLPITGTSLLAGPDSHQTITVMAGGRAQATETITVDGQAYAKHGELWFAQPSSGGAPDLGAVLKTMSSLADLGLVTKDGRTLHRLAPPPGTTIPMASLGAAPAGASDATVTLEFFAEPDGTPAIISIDASWTQKVGNADQPAAMHLDMILSRVGQTITVAAPATVWVTTPSKRLSYTMARPSDWDADLARTVKGTDFLVGPDGQGLGVTRTAMGCRCTLNQMTGGLIRYERSHIKSFKLVSNSAARVGGLRARRLESRGTYATGRSWDLTFLVVRGTYVYVFDYGSPTPLTPQDRTLATQLISTVVFR